MTIIYVEHTCITNSNYTRNIENMTNYGVTKIKKKQNREYNTDRQTKLHVNSQWNIDEFHDGEGGQS